MSADAGFPGWDGRDGLGRGGALRSNVAWPRALFSRVTGCARLSVSVTANRLVRLSRNLFAWNGPKLDAVLRTAIGASGRQRPGNRHSAIWSRIRFSTNANRSLIEDYFSFVRDKNVRKQWLRFAHKPRIEAIELSPRIAPNKTLTSCKY